MHGTFLHVRDSRPLPGAVQVAGFLKHNDKKGGCKGWKVVTASGSLSSEIRDTSQVDGNCVLLHNHYPSSPELSAGDRISIGGQVRTIKALVGCWGLESGHDALNRYFGRR